MHFPKIIDKLFIKTYLLTKSNGLNPNLMRLYSAVLIDLLPDKTCSIAENLYKILFDIEQAPKCKFCNTSSVSFLGFKHGYNEFCKSKNCRKAAIAEKAKKFKDKNGHSWGQSTENLKKRKQTNLKKYGTEFVSQNKKIKEKIKETTIKNHGVSCIFKKIKNQGLHMKDKNWLTNYRYNYELKNGFYPGASEESIKKRRKTNIEKYGTEFGSLHSNESKEKAKNTKRTNVKSKIIDKLNNKNIELLEPYLGINSYQNYKFKCVNCGNFFSTYISNSICCKKCNKISISKDEDKIIAELEKYKIKIIRRSRKIINKKEIDIFLPDFNLAIETNGLYWHSEWGGGKDKYYHLNKTLLCEEQGIQLLHFFEDEISEKFDIVMSMIKIKIKKPERIIFARKCEIKEISTKEAREFFNLNHLNGFCAAQKYFGLFFENRLVLGIAISPNRFGNDAGIEIIRLATSLNTIVVGGFKKILKFISLKFANQNIFSFVDRRFSIGHSYINAGFKQVKISQPNYFYVKKKRFSRQKFQKHKLKKQLKIFNENLSEADNMRLNGFDKIWDCGNIKFMLSN
ncbi:MAG: hypothetical protein QXN55_01820 [Candidatus Nitrosotenuis sp.]